MKKIYSLLATAVLFSSGAFAQGPPPPGPVFDLASGDYSFVTWDSASGAATYPAAMLFKQYTTSSADPTSISDPTEDWKCFYNLTGRSRIVGRGDSGVVFINTANSQTDVQCDGDGSNGVAGKKVGAALLTLSSIGRESVTVSFTAGTVSQSDSTRVYELVLQGRTDSSAAIAWTDVPNGLYSTQGKAANSVQQFSNLVLPGNYNNQAIIQLRWKAYNVTGAGKRPAVSLDDIGVSSSIFTGINTPKADNVALSVFPNPASGEINFNKAISGKLMDVSGREVVSFQNVKNLSLGGITTGIYSLHCTNGEVVKVSVK